jgi:aminoglycoside N3'-acetyltransferase
MIPEYKTRLKTLLLTLGIPRDSVVVAHVRLRGLLPELEGLPGFCYSELAVTLLSLMEEVFQPRGILVPTFTYSFTRTGIYDRTATPCEVGRFGEEMRLRCAPEARTMNPVFSFVDCHSVFDPLAESEDSAFGPETLWARLQSIGHVGLNLNVPGLFSTYIHYLEALHKVPYRFSKRFPGRVSADGANWRQVAYEYSVRDLERDPRWQRQKMKACFEQAGILHSAPDAPVLMRWLRSEDMDRVIGAALATDREFLISDG